ncbi:MAG: MFS transporter [Gaiellales bacterium]
MRRPSASAIVAATFAAAMAATTISTPLYPFYVEQFGISSLDVTIVFAVYGVGVMSSLFVFGRLSDNIGRKPPLAAALALGVVAMAVFVLAQDLAALLVGRALIGLTAGVYTGTCTAWLVDLGEDRGRATRLAVTANLGGLAVGPLAAGFLAQYARAPIRLTYVVWLALLAAGLLLHPRMPETVERRGFDLDFGGLRLPDAVRRVFVPAATAGVAAFGVSGVFGSVGPAMMGEVLGITDPLATGALVTALFGFSVAGQMIAQWVSPTRALPAGCVGLAFSLVLLAAALEAKTVVALVAAAVVAGLAQGTIVGGGLGLLTASAPAERRGQVSSTYFLVLYVGLVLPVVAFGLAEQAWGLITTGYVFCALVGLVVLASGWSVHHRRAVVA